MLTSLPARVSFLHFLTFHSFHLILNSRFLAGKVKQRLVKQRLEFSTFLRLNFIKICDCNSIYNEDYVPANTMHTQTPPHSRAHAASWSLN